MTNTERSESDSQRDVSYHPCPQCGLSFSSAILVCPHDGAVINPNLSLGGSVFKRYALISEAGSGGAGTVYKAKEKKTGKLVAIKLVSLDKITKDSQSRFQAEANACSRLIHKNLIRLYDYGITEIGQPYLILEYIDGLDLSDLLKKAGGVSLLTSIEIAKQLCAGLQYAHAQGILHRDLKPGNIMITWNNGHPFVKIVDFSVAKLHDEETIIAQTALESANEEESDNKNIQMQALNIPFDKVRDVVGTPAYMSPEQIMARDLDQRSDLYSFGCVLFQMLAGMPPYHGKNAVQTVFKQLNEDAPTLASVAPGRSFPQELENIVAKLLKKNPDHRYRNAGELMDDLNLAFAAVSEKESQLPERKKKEFLSYKKSPSSFSSVSPKLAIALLLLFCCMSFIVYDVVRINSVASKNHAHKTSKTPTDKSARVKSSK